jgi:hypothetical protein
MDCWLSVAPLPITDGRELISRHSRILGSSGVNFPPYEGGLQRNSIAATSAYSQIVGLLPREAATRCFAFIQAHFCRCCLSHLTPGPDPEN